MTPEPKPDPDRAAGGPASGATAPVPEDTLAAFVAGLQLEDLPAAVLSRVQDLLLDAIASALAGRATTETPHVEAAARIFAGGGTSTVIGGGGLALAGAVLVNGYEITAATVCDVHRPILCHVTPVVVPAALAIAEGRAAAGSELLAALAAGFETTVRLGLALRYPAFRARGWHSPGVVGPFGAAAATARLLRVNARTTRHALGLAGSQSAGTFAGLGSAQVKFHQARGAVSGVLAGLLAAAGLDAADRILTAPDGGLFTTYADGGQPEMLTAGLGHEWTLMGISLRRWSAASALQAVVQAVLEVRDAPGFDPRLVERVRVGLPEGSYRLNGSTSWHDQLSAFQSAAYVAAVTLLDGRCWLEQFSPGRLADPELRAFVDERVVVETERSLPPGGASITTTGRPGPRTAGVEVPIGDPAAPLSRSDLLAKLEAALAGRGLAISAPQVADLIDGLPGAPSIEPLVAALRSPGA